MGDFKLLNLERAAYAMDLVSPLPLTTARIVRELFYPSHAADNTLDPRVCRLYFGKVIQPLQQADHDGSGRPNRFFNSANFPRSVEHITSGMGQTLGLVHWRAGFDARDVEFIMGGESFSGVELFMIDFNQMRPWNRTKEEIPQLVEAFFVNDPYYPRPRVDDPLYQTFKSGYMSAYPTESAELGEAFLHAIEAHQATSDRG